MGIKTRLKRTIMAVVRWASTNDIDKADRCMPEPYPSFGYASNANLQCNSTVDVRVNYPMTITVHNGQGGRVIMTNSFDRHSKDWIQSMYVLHDEDDLSEELSKIISLESLR